MSFWSRLFRRTSRVGLGDSYDPAQRVLPDPYEPYLATGGIPVMDPGSPLEFVVGNEHDAAMAMWRNQPNLRKVVDFISRNAAIPLQLFDRVSDTERQRITDDPLAQLLRQPAPGMSGFRFWQAVIADGLLYDRWLIVRNDERDYFHHVPSWRTAFDVDALREVEHIRYWRGDEPGRNGISNDSDNWVEVDLETAIYDYGYSPTHAGYSPVRTLRDVLEEGMEAVQYRRDVWRNGARVPGYIHRPNEAPAWNDTHRERFANALRGAYARDGDEAGGLPLLEDGMEIRKVDTFTPQAAQDLEGRRLSAVEVASAYHIAPELIGAQAGNYSNVREYRQMLYRDSLGPYIQAVEGALNTHLLPRFDTRYIEANVEAKLRGSFEEQAQVTTAAIGAPWMTINEGRALRNLPPVADGDVPVQPLNLIYGGQMPSEAGEQNTAFAQAAAAEPTTKAGNDQPSGQSGQGRQREKVNQILTAFFNRQGASVLKRLQNGQSGWWDEDRWHRELAQDLLKVAHTIAGLLGKAEAARLGFPEGYDPDATVEFLTTVAENRASSINETTKAQLDEQLESDEPDPDHVFEIAESTRAAGIAIGVTTFIAGFAATEAARQVARREGLSPTKTWHTTSREPRPTHAAMNGETVPIDEPFSNGMAWPGDGSDADEVAGCQCEVEIKMPEER